MDNELLQSALVELLTTFKESKDFALEQAPDVVQQLIVYTQVLNGIIISFALFLILTGVFGLYKFIQEGRRTEWGDGDYPFWLLLTVIGWMIGFTILTPCLFTFLKVTIAPKVFIIEYISKLL